MPTITNFENGISFVHKNVLSLCNDTNIPESSTISRLYLPSLNLGPKHIRALKWLNCNRQFNNRQTDVMETAIPLRMCEKQSRDRQILAGNSDVEF